MRAIVAITLGILSGLLVYFAAAMIFTPFGSEEANWDAQTLIIFVLATFLGGWIAASFLMLRNSRSVSKVVSRGFLIGAVEWLAMLPAGAINASRIAHQASAHIRGGNAGTAGIASSSGLVANLTRVLAVVMVIGSGLVASLTGVFAIVMVLTCLVGFLVTHLLDRELKSKPADESRQ